MSVEHAEDFGNESYMPGENLVVSLSPDAVSPDELQEIGATEFFPAKPTRTKTTQSGKLSEEEKVASHKAANHKWYEDNRQEVIGKVRQWKHENKAKWADQVRRYRARKRQKQLNLE